MWRSISRSTFTFLIGFRWNSRPWLWWQDPCIKTSRRLFVLDWSALVACLCGPLLTPFAREPVIVTRYGTCICADVSVKYGTTVPRLLCLG